jgi:molybdate transport system substrate-binding protein
MKKIGLFAAGALALVFVSAPAWAAHLTVLSSTGMQSALIEIQPIYEKRTGNKLDVTYLTANLVKDKIDQGAAFDVAILLPPVIDPLIQAGKLAPQMVPLAKSGLGIAVKAGAPAPDLSTPEAFKAALLAAKGVAYTTTGQSGLYFAKLLDQMGIADQVKAKSVTIATGPTAEFVVKGQADIAIQLMPELKAVPGVTVVPFPAAVQNYLKFQGGISPASTHKKTAAAFLKFLASPAAVKVIKAKDMEPGN